MSGLDAKINPDKPPRNLSNAMSCKDKLLWAAAFNKESGFQDGKMFKVVRPKPGHWPRSEVTVNVLGTLTRMEYTMQRPSGSSARIGSRFSTFVGLFFCSTLAAAAGTLAVVVVALASTAETRSATSSRIRPPSAARRAATFSALAAASAASAPRAASMRIAIAGDRCQSSGVAGRSAPSWGAACFVHSLPCCCFSCWAS